MKRNLTSLLIASRKQDKRCVLRPGLHRRSRTCPALSTVASVRTLIALSLTLFGSSAISQARVTAYIGDVTPLSTPPASVETGVQESDTDIYVFAERSLVTLTSPLDVDAAVPGIYDAATPYSPGTIPSGTVINSYFIHVDRIGGGASSVSLRGSLSLDETILGVIYSDANLDSSDYLNNLTSFSTGTANRGLNTAGGLDMLEWGGTSRIRVDLSISGVTDQVRIITQSGTRRRNVTFSIDRQSASSGTVAPSFGGGATIHEGDILTPGTVSPGPNPATTVLPPPNPGVFIGSLALSLGGLSAREVDAFSFGRDEPDGRFYFSVDEWAVGTGTASSMALSAEAAAYEASADVFMSHSPNTLVDASTFTSDGNRHLIDGDGSAIGIPGLGLLDWNPPASTLPDTGDNLDGLDLDTDISDRSTRYIYFSLDDSFPDPTEAPGPNYGSSCLLENMILGTACVAWSGADIFVTKPGSGIITVYATAATLGLGLVGRDDIDALMLLDEAGDDVFDPAVDRIYFSLRRNSPTLGSLDSQLNLPIEEGDVLTIPAGAPGTPAIAVPAEFLGLTTLRNGDPKPDDLNALDAAHAMRPSMAISRNAGGMVEILWDQTETTFRLEETPSLNPPSWAPSTAPALLSSGLWTADVLPTADQSFYRLVEQ